MSGTNLNKSRKTITSKEKDKQRGKAAAVGRHRPLFYDFPDFLDDLPDFQAVAVFFLIISNQCLKCFGWFLTCAESETAHTSNT